VYVCLCVFVCVCVCVCVCVYAPAQLAIIEIQGERVAGCFQPDKYSQKLSALEYLLYKVTM
jgi:hypothetical protein